jgi:hypothetical protein
MARYDALTALLTPRYDRGILPVLPKATSSAPPGAELLTAGAFLVRPTALLNLIDRQ